MKTVIGAVCFAAALMWAQNAGELSGRVTDSRGNPMGNVVIVITGTQGGSQRIVSGPDGTFNVSTLAPGSYRVEIETPNGTRRAATQSVEIASGSPSQIDISFDTRGESSSGTGAGAVEIKATAPTLQTDSAEVSRQYGTQTVRSLPLLDRQHQELIGLMPGVTPPVQSVNRVEDPQRSRIFNVNGQPAFANVYYQDAGYNNEQFTGRASRVSPNESVQALNIRTSNYNAEYGFAGGSWANTITRPGTNRIHGSAFGFHTNEFFQTRNPLNTSTGPDPKFNTNQFGGSVGGPIIPDRMFAFVSYEGYLQRGDRLSFATVPTADLLAGNFSAFGSGVLFDPRTGNTAGGNRLPFAGGQIPATRISPAAQALLGFLPAANQTGLTNNLVGNTRMYDQTHRLDGKLDHRFSERTVGYLRYGLTHGQVEQASLLGPLGDAAQSGLRNHTAVANVSHNFGNVFLAEFRMGFNRYRNAIAPWGDATALNAALAGAGFTNGLPQITIPGFTSFGLAGNYPSKAVNNTYNPAVNFVLHTGINRLKFGAEYRNIQASGFDPGFFSPRGSFVFGPGATALNGAAFNSQAFNPAINSFASFLLGSPTQAGISSFVTTPTWRQEHYAGYLTDTLNLWQKLYLELGVRYEVYSPLKTRNAGGAAIFDPTTNSLGFNGQGNYDERSNMDWDLNNFAPRVGFAISPFRRMAIRGGYGIHYFPLPFAYTALNQAANGTQAGFNGGFGSVPFAVPTAAAPPTGTAANLPYYTTPTDMRTPYVQTYSFIVQTDLTQGFLLDLGYVGSLGRQLPFSALANAGLPGTGIGGLGPDFTQFGRTASNYFRNNGLTNNYNSAQVNLTKRFSAGLSLAASYTYSKALDYGPFSLLNPYDRRSNYGRADWDRTHILAVSHVWRLPFGAGSSHFNSGWGANLLGGWELNGILRWATGTPYTVTADPLLCNCLGVTAVPAAFVGSGSINGASSFNPAFFNAPAGNTFGSLNRNSIQGPDLFNYNLSLFRNFAIRENVKFELRGEVYNLTNSTNYGNPISSLSSPGFGTSLSTFSGMGGRQFQVAGRVLF